MENLKSDSPREDDDGNERFKSISCQGYNNNAYPLVVDNAYNTEALTTAVNLTESMANISLNIDICQNENHNYMVALNNRIIGSFLKKLIEKCKKGNDNTRHTL